MYNPNQFKITDTDEIEKFISEYPFATVVSNGNEGPIISHLPVNKFSDGNLYGHMAVSNSHSDAEENTPVTAIFTGPHAYISPTYYVSAFNVPTWNYSSVHCTGKLKFIIDAEVVWKLFNEMLLIYEGKEGWSLPNEEKFQSLSNSIRFFCIESPKFEAKFKFNQNKTPEDVKSVIDSLESNGEIEASIFMRNCQNG